MFERVWELRRGDGVYNEQWYQKSLASPGCYASIVEYCPSSVEYSGFVGRVERMLVGGKRGSWKTCLAEARRGDGKRG